MLECQVLVVELLLYASHRIPQTLAAIQPLVNQAQPESCQRLVIEPGHAMVLRKTFQASAHAVHRGLDIRGIQIHHDHSQMVAMMEFFFPQKTALQAVNQSKNLCIGHFCCSKEKRPPAIRTDRRDLCSLPE